MSNSTPLNTGMADYNSVAVMLGYAFDYADRVRRSSSEFRDAVKAEIGRELSVPNLVDHYVHLNASDRRYKIRWGAWTDSSAIVTYRARRYYVEGQWDSKAQLRDHYIYAA